MAYDITDASKGYFTPGGEQSDMTYTTDLICDPADTDNDCDPADGWKQGVAYGSQGN